MSNDGWNKKPDKWEQDDEFINQMINVNKEITEQSDQIHNFDVIFVLAGGLTDNGLIHEWVIRRLNKAYSLYCQKKVKIVCLGGGTYHKPPILNKDRYVVHESTACAQYLITLGVDAKDVYREWSSYDTIANAYFAITNYLLPFNFKKPVIITSDFHLPRTKTVFNWLFNLIGYQNPEYCSASDENIDSDIINCRKEREIKSLKNLETFVVPKIKSFSDFAKWFFEDHQAYCSSMNSMNNKIVDRTLLKSY